MLEHFKISKHSKMQSDEKMKKKNDLFIFTFKGVSCSDYMRF